MYLIGIVDEIWYRESVSFHTLFSACKIALVDPTLKPLLSRRSNHKGHQNATTNSYWKVATSHWARWWPKGMQWRRNRGTLFKRPLLEVFVEWFVPLPGCLLVYHWRRWGGLTNYFAIATYPYHHCLWGAILRLQSKVETYIDESVKLGTHWSAMGKFAQKRKDAGGRIVRGVGNASASRNSTKLSALDELEKGVGCSSFLSWVIPVHVVFACKCQDWSYEPNLNTCLSTYAWVMVVYSQYL